MKKLSPTNNNSIAIIFLFLLSGIITLAKIQDRHSIPVSFIHHPSETKTELVVPAATPNFSYFYSLLIPVKHVADFSSKHIDQSSINGFSLIYFNEYISYRIKISGHNFVAANQIVTTLQKSNITHLSSEENHSLLG